MAKFVKSVQTINDIDLAKNMIDFCFFGRSNVGKSSLINALANQTISRTSKHPGRTQLINIFSFNNYRIIDLPGYGYANVSKDKKINIDNMLNDYINHSLTLFAVFLICDASFSAARKRPFRHVPAESGYCLSHIFPLTEKTVTAQRPTFHFGFGYFHLVSKCHPILRASASPTPFTAPDPRYRSMEMASAGGTTR